MAREPAAEPVTTVYTDGACLGNPGPGGWAWAVPGGRHESGAEPMTTNQRMEIRAVLEAVRALDGPLEVVSDSTYVVNCFRDRWWEGWLRRGWTTSQRRPVVSRDLWEPLIDIYRSEPTRLRFRWVKGHGDDPMNDLVDRLAAEAARTQKGRSGERPPGSLGAPDVVGPTEDPRVPPGHRITVAGHKPPELGGYDDNPTARALRARLTEILTAKRAMNPDVVVMTGLGLGAEQLAAEAAADAGVPYVAVLPFPEPDGRWPQASRDRYRSLLSGAAGTVLLQARSPDSKQTVASALARRDDWLARHAHEAIAVWDRADAMVGRTVRSLRDRLGEENVWVVEPPG